MLAAVPDRGETGYSKLSKNNPTPVCLFADLVRALQSASPS